MRRIVLLIAVIAAAAVPSTALAHKHSRHHHALKHHVARRADAAEETDAITPAELAVITAEGEAQEDEGRTAEEAAFAREPITPESSEEERQYEGF